MVNDKHITADDKVVADFMGIDPKDEGKYSYIYYFHTSWDWLMPVYHKITGEDLYEENEDGIVLFNIIYDRLGDGCVIEEVYDSITAFIKWYNKEENNGKE